MLVAVLQFVPSCSWYTHEYNVILIISLYHSEKLAISNFCFYKFTETSMYLKPKFAESSLFA